MEKLKGESVNINLRGLEPGAWATLRRVAAEKNQARAAWIRDRIEEAVAAYNAKTGGVK